MYSKAMIRQIHAGVSSIGLALNLLAIFLILKNKHSVVGRYAYLLFCFSIINLVYVLVDLLFAPANIVSGHTFMLVNLSVSLPTPWLNYIPVILYCVLCCQTLVFLMFQFVYRYAQVCRNSFLWKISKPKLALMCFSIFFAYSTIWSLDVLFCMTPHDSNVYAAMERLYSEKFSSSLNDTGFIGISYDPELNPDLWVGYLGTFLVIGMLASIWMVIIYSGYNVYNALSTARIVSKKTKSLQQELFRALVIQLLIPLFFNYLPMSLIFASAIFRISVDLELTGLLFMLDPFIEPVVIIYFIKCYRTSFYRIFCCRSVTGSQVYSSQNAKFSQQIKANSTSAAGGAEPTEGPSGAKPEIFVSIPE